MVSESERSGVVMFVELEEAENKESSLATDLERAPVVLTVGHSPSTGSGVALGDLPDWVEEERAGGTGD